jgi:membrane protein DedA with SNARE-associated domain
MLVQNVLAVFLVQAEARNRALLAGLLAGLLDCLMWPAGMVTTTITVTALQGHHAGLKGEVIAAVTLANFVGSSAAVRLGRRFIRARRQ